MPFCLNFLMTIAYTFVVFPECTAGVLRKDEFLWLPLKPEICASSAL